MYNYAKKARGLASLSSQLWLKFIKTLDVVYRGKEKRNESFLFFSVVVPKLKPSKRKIYSKCLLETFRVRGNVEGDRTEVDICRFLGRHSEFLAPRSRVHCESLVDKHRGSSIFSLANFNEPRIIEIPTISHNWQRINFRISSLRLGNVFFLFF